MQAVIIAAGKSTRTYPLTLTKPKPMLKVAGIPILEHNLKQLQHVVKEAIIIIGYKGNQIQDYFGEEYGHIKLKYIVQEKQDGNGSALLLAKDLLKDKFIVMNSDDLFSKKDIKKCLKHKYCVLVKEMKNLSNFGHVVPDKEKNKIFKFQEKPGNIEGLANTGLLVLDKEIFKYKLELSRRDEYELTDYLTYLIDTNEVYFEKAEFWLPITYPWSLLEANKIFLDKIKTDVRGKIEKNVIIKGEVIVGKKTIIKSGAYIEGPVILGEECKIGPNCYIRSYTVIGNRSKVGNAVEIKNTIVGEDTSVGHLTYLGDSVIGDKVNFGAGTITANLRHDDENIETPVKDIMIDTGRRKLGTIIGDGVHTGIHTSIYPGRKIWPNKITLPGEIVKRDIK